MFKRILQIIRKEFIQIWRDSGLVRMVVMTPLLQLLIYGYVVATEIRALPMVVLDRVRIGGKPPPHRAVSWHAAISIWKLRRARCGR